MSKFIDKVADYQLRYSFLIVLVAYVLSILALPLVSQLSLNGDFTALLPQHKQSVVDLQEVQTRLGRHATLTLAIEGSDINDVRVFTEDLSKRLKEIPDAHIKDVDWNVKDFLDFLKIISYIT